MPTIEIAIRNEAEKLIKRHEMYMSNLAAELRRKSVRSGLPTTKEIIKPIHWSIANGFNPYYVKKHAKAIAKSIERKLANREYSPHPAFQYEVPKAGGGIRKISLFQVADSALSHLTFKRLMAKNARHLSASAYAYRQDLSIHDAILHIASDLQRRNRVYLAEFDFAKYFESISHKHLLDMLNDRRFYVTLRERYIIERFLKTPICAAQEYIGPHLESPKTHGIPLGTSISLFLANLAAYPLDKRLERLGVGFARYADDTLIWSDSYPEIVRSSIAPEDTAKEMGVDLNFAKSKGITLLAPPGLQTEIISQNFVNFLGYKISQESLSIRQESVKRIKKHISFLIYQNLLQEPKRGNFVSNRILGQGKIDLDYPVLIYQLRRYLYGGLSEAMLRRFLYRQTPNLRFKGLMSFYPIVDDEPLLRSLDGWMLASVVRAIKLRGKLWQQYFPGSLPPPHGKTPAQVLQLRYNPLSGPLQDLRFPSFLRISKLLRRAAATYGAGAIANAKSASYYSPPISLSGTEYSGPS
jgi:RNA-directed DNA polymerase